MSNILKNTVSERFPYSLSDCKIDISARLSLFAKSLPIRPTDSIIGKRIPSNASLFKCKTAGLRLNDGLDIKLSQVGCGLMQCLWPGQPWFN